MKKAYSICILTLLPFAHTAMGHSAEIVHLHPYGENVFLTIWLMAAAVGVAFGGRTIAQRIRQN